MSIVEFHGGPITRRYLDRKSKHDLATMVLEYAEVVGRLQGEYERGWREGAEAMRERAAWAFLRDDALDIGAEIRRMSLPDCPTAGRKEEK